MVFGSFTANVGVTRQSTIAIFTWRSSDWFFVGNGGMSSWDYYRGPLKGLS